MTHNLILTNTSAPSAPFMKALEKFDVQVFHAPVLSVIYHSDILNFPFLPRTLIVTSKHSLRHIVDYGLSFDIPVWCVGETTKMALINSGFHNIVGVLETGEQLIQEMQRNPASFCDSVFLRGKDVQTNVRETCIQFGIKIYDPIVYHTSIVPAWGEETLSQIQNNDLTIFGVFSSRGAQALCTLLNQHHLQDHVTRTNLLCLSDRMLKYLDNFRWKDCWVSERPTQQSFLDQLDLVTKMES